MTRSEPSDSKRGGTERVVEEGKEDKDGSRLTTCCAVDMRAEGVKVELEVLGHRLEVAGADLHGQVVRHDER